MPHHDSYSVKLDVPTGHTLAASGRLDQETGRFEAEAVRSFGVYLGRGMKAESRDAGRQNHLQGISTYRETPLEITPADEERIHYERNNVVFHSKGPALLSALEVVLGRSVFQRIYRQVVHDYGGKRLGWRDLQRTCERETGQSLAWFFEQWVRSSAYLCYRIEARDCRAEDGGFRTDLRVRRLGTMSTPAA